jgi:predicted O-methyltransferase YrrM
MRQLTRKEFLKEQKAHIEEAVTYTEDFIWGDTSDKSKLDFLASLVKHRFCDKNILEIGTYRGTTTYTMAANITEGTICTVDCGYEELKGLIESETPEHADKIKYSPYEVGEVYKQNLSNILNIKQVIGNTTNTNTAEQIIKDGPYDLIYVDAAHTYDGIKNDTELSLRCIADGGMIIWDDYNGWWTGVNKFLDELDQAHELTYITDNRYVIYLHKANK